MHESLKSFWFWRRVRSSVLKGAGFSHFAISKISMNLEKPSVLASPALACPGLASLVAHAWKKRERRPVLRALVTPRKEVHVQSASASVSPRPAIRAEVGVAPPPGPAPRGPPPPEAALPRHLAVIMDGNSRWARQKGLPAFSGHQTGVDAMRRTVQFCCRRGIQALTVYCFSCENWERDAQEVEFLLKLVERVVQQELEELLAAGVQLRFIGDHASLPASLVKQLKR